METTHLYRDIHETANAFFDRAWFTNLSNTSAVLMDRLPDINWAGFYLLRGEELLLGPFQGQPACLRIPLGKGVCGTVAATRKSLCVPDVDQFPGHIACDSRSRSEIAIPMLAGTRLLGVLDVDSPHRNRFAEEDRIGLEKLVAELVQKTDWPEGF